MFNKARLLGAAALSMLGMASAGAIARVVDMPPARGRYKEPESTRPRPYSKGRQRGMSAFDYRALYGRRDGVNPAGTKLANRAAKGLITKQGSR